MNPMITSKIQISLVSRSMIVVKDIRHTLIDLSNTYTVYNYSILQLRINLTDPLYEKNRDF